jgi:hypothetical protein
MIDNFEKPSYMFTHEYAKSLFLSRVGNQWTEFEIIMNDIFDEDKRYLRLVKKRTKTFYGLLAELVTDNLIEIKKWRLSFN